MCLKGEYPWSKASQGQKKGHDTSTPWNKGLSFTRITLQNSYPTVALLPAAPVPNPNLTSRSYNLHTPASLGAAQHPVILSQGVPTAPLMPSPNPQAQPPQDSSPTLLISGSSTPCLPQLHLDLQRSGNLNQHLPSSNKILLWIIPLKKRNETPLKKPPIFRLRNKLVFLPRIPWFDYKESG